MEMKILKEDHYRSDPLVNGPYDMVRVTLYGKRWKWRETKKRLNKLSSYDVLITMGFEQDKDNPCKWTHPADFHATWLIDPNLNPTKLFNLISK